VAGGINQQIQQSLKNAGPFGPILSNLGTGLVNRALGGITNAITGATSPGSGTNIKMWPGGGGPGEEPADYGGRAFTLDDIVFSLQPANQGPQAFGDFTAAFDPKIGTKLPFGDLINADFGVDYPLVNDLKKAVMKPTAFSGPVGDFSTTRTLNLA
jgi:hypothetical protein